MRTVLVWAWQHRWGGSLLQSPIWLNVVYVRILHSGVFGLCRVSVLSWAVVGKYRSRWLRILTGRRRHGYSFETTIQKEPRSSLAKQHNFQWDPLKKGPQPTCVLLWDPQETIHWIWTLSATKICCYFSIKGCSAVKKCHREASSALHLVLVK